MDPIVKILRTPINQLELSLQVLPEQVDQWVQHLEGLGYSIIAVEYGPELPVSTIRYKKLK